MNVRPEQLAAQLKQDLKPVYVVFGDEHLLVQEACDSIRAAARGAGFSEREVYHVEGQFKWDDFLASGSALSLFAARKLIELRLPTGKPGDAGSKALQAYCEMPSEDNLLLVIAPKLDRSSQNTKWFKALDKVGAHVAIWPIDHQQLPRWIDQRLKQAGIAAERDAVKLLADLVDGNLLAAAQEVEKLKLIASDQTITPETVKSSVSDSSRYNVFNLVDAALKGDTQHVVKIIAGLRGEGVEPITVVWALSREVRQLTQMARAMEQGQSAQQVMQQFRVWKNRQNITGSTLSRLRASQLEQLVRKMALADQSVKGMQPGNAWDYLETTALTLAGAKLASA